MVQQLHLHLSEENCITKLLHMYTYVHTDFYINLEKKF